MKFLGLIVIILTALFFSGCLIVRVGNSRKPLPSHSKSFSHVENGKTTRAKIINELGPFDVYYDDSRIGAYYLNEVTRNRLWLVFGVIPCWVDHIPDRTEVAYFVFDSSDLVVRHRVIINHKDEPKEWLKQRLSGNFVGF